MIRLARRAALVLMLAYAALASPAHAADSPNTAAVQAPVANLDTALIAVMKAGKGTPFQKRYLALAPAVEGALDLQAILQNSVGLGWAQIPAAQQIQLRDAFERFTVASYLANFDSYDGQTFQILPALRQVGSEWVVQTRLVPRSGDPTKLDYVMHQTPEGWRATDVLLDGTISRVAVQRSDFRSLFASGGAPALIQSLEKKVSTLSGGAMK